MKFCYLVFYFIVERGEGVYIRGSDIRISGSKKEDLSKKKVDVVFSRC